VARAFAAAPTSAVTWRCSSRALVTSALTLRSVPTVCCCFYLSIACRLIACAVICVRTCVQGKNLANPTGMLLASVMMLRHLSLPGFADRIERAVLDVHANKAAVTRDIGGTASTSDFVKACKYHVLHSTCFPRSWLIECSGVYVCALCSADFAGEAVKRAAMF
jgi:hypothetical protein